MKRGIVLLAASFAASLSLAAQEGSSFSLTGALEPSVGWSAVNDDSAFASMPGSTPAGDMSAGGGIDGKISFSRGYAAMGLLDFSLSDGALIDHETGATVETRSFEVNELYADLNFDNLLFLRLGKQRLSWGAGFVFNPSDPVNPPKDPRDTRAPREGVPALKAEIIAKPVSLLAFSVLHDDFSELGYGAKLSTSVVKNSDLSLSGYWSPSQSWTGALNASIAPFYDFPGWDSIQLWFEGSVYDKGRYEAFAEGSPAGAAATKAAEGTQYAFLGGASAQIPVLRTMLLAEFYHLSEGLSASELSSVYEALGSPDAEVPQISKLAIAAELARRPGRQASDYLFASLSQPSITDSGDPVLDKIGLSASCLVNLVDGSTYATGGLSLGFVADSAVEIDASWARGATDSEFGNAPSLFGLGLTLKVFF